MMPLADVIAGIRRNLYAVPFALEREVGAGMAEAAKLAKSYIGNEQPGWAPLAASTIEEKAALGYEVPAPLLREGDLRDSIESEVETSGREVTGIVGSTDPIAIFFSTGTSRMPPRPFLEPAFMLTEPKITAALGELALRLLTPGAQL